MNILHQSLSENSSLTTDQTQSADNRSQLREIEFDNVLKLVRNVFDVPVVGLSFIKRDEIWFKDCFGVYSGVIPKRNTCCDSVFVNDQYLEIEDLDRCNIEYNRVKGTHGDPLQFYAGLPVHDCDGVPIGTLFIMDHQPRALSDLERSLFDDIRLVVEDLVNSIENQRLHAEIESELALARKVALTDSLTGIWNRKGILDVLEREVSRHQRSGQFLGVVYGDIDHFKSINDRFGHPAGDEVIRQVSRRMCDELRLYDSVGRIGGEEFLMIIPGESEQSILDVVERIRARVAGSPIRYGDQDIETSISFGLVTNAILNTAVELINEADRCLYASKSKGRNCTTLSNVTVKDTVIQALDKVG